MGFAILSGWITNAADLIYARHLQPNAGFANVTNTSQGESAATPVSRNMVNYKVPAARVHARFGSTREPRGQPLRHMEQLLLVTSCDSPAGIGASIRTHRWMDRQTDFYVEIVF